MKTKYILVLILITFFTHLYAQTCIHTNLSKTFNFKITRIQTKMPGPSSLYGQSMIVVEIRNKVNDQIFQKIQFISDGLFSDDFKICSSERSLMTGKNKNADVIDNDYGDIVVADLNFDGKEDIAIKNEWIGNIGAGYRFYIQTPNGFKEDHYLTDTVSFFPWFLNSKKKILITTVSPTPGTTIRQYKYNSITKKWLNVSTRFVWHDEHIDYILNQLKK